MECIGSLKIKDTYSSLKNFMSHFAGSACLSPKNDNIEIVQKHLKV